MTLLRARRRRPARSRGGAALPVAVVLVLVAVGVLEHFAGPVIAALAAGLIVGFFVGRAGDRPARRRRRRL